MGACSSRSWARRGACRSFAWSTWGGVRVLIPEGDELVGAKQNRTVNSTALIAADSELVLSVSCVERGRWSRRPRSFASNGATPHLSLRHLKPRSVALGAKAVELVHRNVRPEAACDDPETLVMDAEVLEGLLDAGDPEKKSGEVEIKLISRLGRHGDVPDSWTSASARRSSGRDTSRASSTASSSSKSS